jgi:gluconate 2-dehydrogenase gamma chain
MAKASDTTSRRDFVFQTLSFLPLAIGGVSLIGEARAAAAQGDYMPVYFNQDEWKFLSAFVGRLIPADDIGPGAIDAGVAIFIDKQMDTPYGHGKLWYMQGPFVTAPPQLGYQLPLAPRELYRQGIAAADQAVVQKYGKHFAALDAATQDEAMRALESGALDIGTATPAKAFFAQVLTNTHEGYFADPVYGGNEDMGAWKMINFPGARADYTDWVNQYGVEYPYPPASIQGEGS